MRCFVKLHPRCLLALILVLVVSSGCTRQEVAIETSVPEKYLFPETPDDLMTNFVTAYTTGDVAGYAALLHEDFLFTFQACDVEKLGLSSDHTNREDEIETARHMFSGQDHVKSDGQVVAAVTEIRFERWEQVGAWRGAEESAPAGAMRVNVECRVVLERQGASTLTVQGQSVFTALPVLIETPGGGFRAGYQLLGWVDLTGPCGP